MKFYRAPWHKRFPTVCFKGSLAYEAQIGPFVVQWFYKPWEYARLGSRLHIWRDRYWR